MAGELFNKYNTNTIENIKNYTGKYEEYNKIKINDWIHNNVESDINEHIRDSIDINIEQPDTPISNPKESSPELKAKAKELRAKEKELKAREEAIKQREEELKKKEDEFALRQNELKAQLEQFEESGSEIINLLG
jgi:ATP-dependent Clp protease ATP-binding subunit ClpA